MFFILSKIFAFLLTPYFWIMAILLWAILTKKQNRRKWLIVAVFCLSYILGNTFLMEETARTWELPATQSDQLKDTFDVGIVLGGYASYDTLVSRIQFHESSDRLWQALNLYKTGKVKKLLLSGGSGSLLHKDDTEANRVYNFLLDLGVKKSDILMEVKSKNTRENAVESAKLIQRYSPDAKCLLITSAFHMRRALGCYKKVHLDVVPYTSDFIAGPRRWDPDKLFIPSAYGLDTWNKIIREIIGFYTYKVMGYL